MSSQDRDPRSGESVLTAVEGLLPLVAQGQPAPFRRLYDLTSARIFAVATAVVQDTGSAEEVTRQVFADVWRLAGSFDPASGTAMDWLMRLTRARSIACLHERRSARMNDDQRTAAGVPVRSAAHLLGSVARQGSEYLMSLRPVVIDLALGGR